MTKEKNFLSDYFKELSDLLESSKNHIQSLLNIKDELVKSHKRGKKTLIFGNGGSAATASHFSVDLTKNAKVRCVNFNESDLITCFANDYGYENWMSQAVEHYGDEMDNLLLLSCSGKSQNLINACKKARDKKFNKIFTFTGLDKNNPLSKQGDVNIWVNSEAYNVVENLHHAYLLSIVDLIIGKKIYPPN
tara:strand:+ start:47 stop:619 length:573 start_codon:yes stop_codon:yes gene_type:complete